MHTKTVALTGVILLTLLSQPHSHAQSTFATASVRPGSPDVGYKGGCRGIDYEYRPGYDFTAVPLGTCVITNGRLAHFIMFAWGIHGTNDIKSESDWISSGDYRYSIEAKLEDPKSATQQQLLSALQKLLIDRFQLKFHRETIDKAGFSLVVAQNGPKVRDSAAARAGITFPTGRPTLGRPASFGATRYSMQMLATYLGGINAAPVVDKTGLAGFYDFTVSWDDSVGLPLSSALQDQLGLRLEPRSVPISLFVVDSANKPDAR